MIKLKHNIEFYLFNNIKYILLFFIGFLTYFNILNKNYFGVIINIFTYFVIIWFYDILIKESIKQEYKTIQINLNEEFKLEKPKGRNEIN